MNTSHYSTSGGHSSSNNLLTASSTYMQGYLSSLAANNNGSGNLGAGTTPSVSQSMVFYDKNRQHETEIHELKREMRKKEIENEKAKAIMQQKVELLELQLAESHEREENIKKMHETLMNALQGGETGSNGTVSPLKAGRSRELEYAEALHKKDLSDLKSEYDSQVKDLKSQLSNQSREFQLQIESIQIELARAQSETEIRLREQENRLKREQGDRERELKEEAQNEKDSLKKEINELNRQITSHLSESEYQQKKFEELVNDSKVQLTKERQESEEAISRLKVQIKSLEQDFQSKLQAQIQTSQEKYLKEVDELHSQIFETQRRHREEILTVLKERDEVSELKIKLEKQLEKLKSAPKQIKTINLNQDESLLSSSRSISQHQTNQRLSEENDYLSTQLTKLSAQLKEIRQELSHSQTAELSAKRDLNQKLSDFESERIEHQRRINEEKRKITKMEDEVASKTQESLKHKTHSEDKDQVIEELRREIQEYRVMQGGGMSTMILGGIGQSPIGKANQNSNGMMTMGMNNMSMVSTSRDFMALASAATINGRNPSSNHHHRSVSPINQQQQLAYQSSRSALFLNNHNKLSPSPRGLSALPINDNSQLTSNNRQNRARDLPLQTTSNGKINGGNDGEISVNRGQSNNTHQITTTELKLYQTCQKMVDAASQMECSECSQILPTTVFYDHVIQQECQHIKSNNNNFLSNNSSTQRSNNMIRNQEEFTMCLGGVDDSCTDFKLKHHRATKQDLSKLLQQSRDFMHHHQTHNNKNNVPLPNNQRNKDKFAMTHCSTDFSRHLKNQSSQKSLASLTNMLTRGDTSQDRTNKMFKNTTINISSQNPIKEGGHPSQASVTQQNITIREKQPTTTNQDLIKQAIKKQLNLNLDLINQQKHNKNSKLQSYLSTNNQQQYQVKSDQSSSSCQTDSDQDYDTENDSSQIQHQQSATHRQLNHRQQQDTDSELSQSQAAYGTVRAEPTTLGNPLSSRGGQESSSVIYATLQSQNNLYQNRVTEESPNEEEDSGEKERRIRKQGDRGDADIGNEGDKSTYLRPSRNRSAMDISVQSQKKKEEKVVVKKQGMGKKQGNLRGGGTKKDKENQGGVMPQRGRGAILTQQQLNTCRNPQVPSYTFRQHDSNQPQPPTSQPDFLKLGALSYIQPDTFKGAFSTRQLPNNGQTTKKSGNRYNALLRCSSSGIDQQYSNSKKSSTVSLNQSMLSPRQLQMFSGRQQDQESRCRKHGEKSSKGTGVKQGKNKNMIVSKSPSHLSSSNKSDILGHLFPNNHNNQQQHLQFYDKQSSLNSSQVRPSNIHHHFNHHLHLQQQDSASPSQTSCLPYSDLVSPNSGLQYTSTLQQHFREYENQNHLNNNSDQQDLLIIGGNNIGKKNLMSQFGTNNNNEKQQKEMMLSGIGMELLSEEDLDFFDGGHNNGLNNPNQQVITLSSVGCPQSSRHNGTHGLVPSLIAQQENKYNSLSQQEEGDNLLHLHTHTYNPNYHHTYHTHHQYKHSESADNMMMYYTNGSSDASHVVIGTRREGLTSHQKKDESGNKQQDSQVKQTSSMKKSERKMYNSTQNPQTLRTMNKEQQMYVIRESCPSPLGEDEMIDDLGCPFDNRNVTQQNLNISSVMLSSKQPSSQQDQILHILPKPKFIQTLPAMIRMRSITQMNVQPTTQKDAVEKKGSNRKQKQHHNHQNRNQHFKEGGYLSQKQIQLEAVEQIRKVADMGL